MESILRDVRLEREEHGSVRLPILAGLRSLALELRRHPEDENDPDPLGDERRRALADEALAEALPTLRADTGDLAALTDACWHAVALANDPAQVFRFGDLLARIERDSEGAPMIRPLTIDRTRHLLARSAQWTRVTAKGKIVDAHPPLDAVRDMLATPEPPLPVLSRIVEVSVF